MDFEHCSRSTLFGFAALVDVAGWVAVVAVTWGVCIMIEWVAA